MTGRGPPVLPEELPCTATAARRSPRFRALERIGRDLEHPFHNAVHDVPLTAICRTIEINLRQCLGETDLPPPAEPVRGVLW